ncbi:MAG: LCP family protein [Clostridia bacterium]
MGENRTPDNKDSGDIKGGGNPFVDYDFYLNANGDRKQGNAGVGKKPARSSVPAAKQVVNNGKRNNGSRRPAPAPDSGKKPWYIRAREGIVRFYSTRRPLKVTLTVVIALLLIAVTVVLSFTYGILGKINTNGDDDESRDAVFENESNFAMMTDPTSQSFRAMLKEWATNGEKMHSKNVVNILLVGMDESGMRSDSMIVASVNKKAKTVTLASIYRDCLTYAEINGRDRYLKLNQVAQYASLNRTIETIENNFKIEIDDYVAVDFTSFPKVIDAVGGVSIDITDAEYRWLLNHEGVNVGGSGTQHLNGDQALAYCRIRYLDSDGDVSRTERQRKVLASLLNASKDATMGQITDTLDVLLPAVTTSMSRTGILSLATQALSGQWYNYQVKSIDIPSEEARYGQNGVSTSVESGAWVWLVDYPLAAQEMQLALYGDTNVELSEGRVTAIDVYLGRSSGTGGSSSGGSYSSGDDGNDDQDEPTRAADWGYEPETETERETLTEPVSETETSTERESQTTDPQTTQPEEGDGDDGLVTEEAGD